jgi:hypothetical protein
LKSEKEQEKEKKTKKKDSENIFSTMSKFFGYSGGKEEKFDWRGKYSVVAAV